MIDENEILKLKARLELALGALEMIQRLGTIGSVHLHAKDTFNAVMSDGLAVNAMMSIISGNNSFELIQDREVNSCSSSHDKAES